MAAPDRIKQLVDKFAADPAQFRNTNYNETQTRVDFVNPLFAELGWDMGNRGGLAENLREVVHEDKVKVGLTMKAPDYSFRIGGQRKFFVETKKPGVFLKVQSEPAYQLRRYAWTAKLPVSILTDFEEFAIYDGRVPPEQKDPASRARLDYFTYKDYEEKWDEIHARFSRAAVAGGSLDKLADTGRRGIPVDAKFLEVISGWREKLARHLAENNPLLTPRALNFAVQMILDRIIFLRICEDRGVETEFRLSPLLNGTNTYARLLEVFHHADDRYNSGLFHFKQEVGRDAPDSITGGLHIADRPIKEILAGLYYPESPFEFSVFPADILGQVYEQFLGKIIRIESKTAVVEDKPEVKKAGGVFYTPTYIVDYIVEHTVGRLLEGKTPKQVSAISILDPACGSGSFLIGAYQFLLDWHLRWYAANEPEKEAKRKSAAVFQNGTDEQSRPRWRLTTAEKKRILLNNIYGVDIDTQAVEVTKLSLLLKVLEGESAETVNANLKLFKERALPDLEANIRCGNSLVGLDFYADPARAALSTEEQVRINAFDWNAAFPTIMQGGGFDAVIGNPPYIFGEYHDAAVKKYFQTQYELARSQYDTYWLFIERGLSLTRRKGYFSLIVPDALLARDEVTETRALLLNAGLESVYHCGLVFENAAVSATVFCVSKGVSGVGVHGKTRTDKQAVSANICSPHRFEGDVKRRFLIHMSDEQAKIINRLHQRCTTFEDAKLLHISRGEETGKKFVLNSGPVPILVGEDISRYRVKAPSRFVAEYFKHSAFYAAPKIVLVKTGDKAIAALDKAGLVTMQSVYNLHVTGDTVAAESVLAILNSKFIHFYLSKTFTAYKLLFPQINQTTVLSLPVPKDLAQQQSLLIAQVERMHTLHTQLTLVQTSQERAVVARQITATDVQIDKLVYDLYGLTEEEIELVGVG